MKSLGYPKIRLVGHDIGLMVAHVYAAQYQYEVESIVLMDAFLPGVGDGECERWQCGGAAKAHGAWSDSVAPA